MLSLYGLDGVMDQLVEMGSRMDEIAGKMLEAGEAEVVKAWQQVAPVKTGAMRDSVRGHRIKGGVMSEVYPAGKDAHGVRNAEKAFILHYGTKKIPASHWVDKAEEIAEKTATEAMEAVFNEMMGDG